MLAYFVKMVKGDFVGADTKQVEAIFGELTSNRNEMLFWMILISVLGLIVCSMGLQNGVEKMTKFMMSSLFVIMLILVVRATTLDGAVDGLKFYLLPDFGKMAENGFKEAVFAAMGQSFFTLSVRNWCTGNLWKLYWKREKIDWRGNQHHRSGYGCSACCRSDHISILFCI